MKKFIAILLVLVIGLFAFTACNKDDNSSAVDYGDYKPVEKFDGDKLKENTDAILAEVKAKTDSFSSIVTEKASEFTKSLGENVNAVLTNTSEVMTSLTASIKEQASTFVKLPLSALPPEKIA